MPIQISCPDCRAPYNLADTMAGKSVRCQKCQSIITVPGGPEYGGPIASAPARRPAAPPSRSPVRPPPRREPSVRRRDDEEEESATSGMPLGWILGGAGAFLVLAIGVVIVGIMMTSRAAEVPDPAQFANNNPPPFVNNNPPPFQNPNQFPNLNQAPDPNQDQNPKDVVIGGGGVGLPRVDRNPRPKNNPPPNNQNNGGQMEKPADLAPWKAEPDPRALDFTIPAAAKLSAPYGTDIHQFLFFPSRSSPFLMKSRMTGPTAIYDIVDVRTCKSSGIVAPPDSLLISTTHALSPDGKLFATKLNTPGNANVISVGVWSTNKGTALGTVKVEGTANQLKLVDFAGEDKLITGIETNDGLRLQVWDLKNKAAKVCDIAAAAHADRRKIGISEGNKFVAVHARKNDRVMVYDLRSGASVGELFVPKESPFDPDCQALVFSPDGKQLAGLFNIIQSSKILVWDMKTGEQKADHRFEQSVMRMSKMHIGYQGYPVLQWLDDSTGWVGYGGVLIDAEKGTAYHNIQPDHVLDVMSRRVYGNKVARVKGANAKTLVLEDISPAPRRP